MALEVFLAVLAGALMHASWNAMTKGLGGADPLTSSLLVALGGAVVAVPVLLLLTGFPAAASTPYIVASTIIHLAYFPLVGLSYRHADFSAVYPLMRGAAPLLIAMFGALGLSGNALLRGGMFRRGLLMAGANVAVIVAYTLVDGLGARASGNPPAMSQASSG